MQTKINGNNVPENGRLLAKRYGRGPFCGRENLHLAFFCVLQFPHLTPLFHEESSQAAWAISGYAR